MKLAKKYATVTLLKVGRVPQIYCIGTSRRVNNFKEMTSFLLLLDNSDLTRIHSYQSFVSLKFKADC